MTSTAPPPLGDNLPNNNNEPQQHQPLAAAPPPPLAAAAQPQQTVQQILESANPTIVESVQQILSTFSSTEQTLDALATRLSPVLISTGLAHNHQQAKEVLIALRKKQSQQGPAPAPAPAAPPLSKEEQHERYEQKQLEIPDQSNDDKEPIDYQQYFLQLHNFQQKVKDEMHGGGGGNNEAPQQEQQPVRTASESPPPLPLPPSLAVFCGNTKGTFFPQSQGIVCTCRTCTKQSEITAAAAAAAGKLDQQHKFITPGEFEIHAGMGHTKKWKYSIKVEGSVERYEDFTHQTTLGEWMEAHGLVSRYMNRGPRAFINFNNNNFSGTAGGGTDPSSIITVPGLSSEEGKGGVEGGKADVALGLRSPSGKPWLGGPADDDAAAAAAGVIEGGDIDGINDNDTTSDGTMNGYLKRNSSTRLGEEYQAVVADKPQFHKQSEGKNDGGGGQDPREGQRGPSSEDALVHAAGVERIQALNMPKDATIDAWEAQAQMMAAGATITTATATTTSNSGGSNSGGSGKVQRKLTAPVIGGTAGTTNITTATAATTTAGGGGGTTTVTKHNKRKPQHVHSSLVDSDAPMPESADDKQPHQQQQEKRSKRTRKQSGWLKNTVDPNQALGGRPLLPREEADDDEEDNIADKPKAIQKEYYKNNPKPIATQTGSMSTTYESMAAKIFKTKVIDAIDGGALPRMTEWKFLDNETGSNALALHVDVKLGNVMFTGNLTPLYTSTGAGMGFSTHPSSGGSGGSRSRAAAFLEDLEQDEFEDDDEGINIDGDDDDYTIRPSTTPRGLVAVANKADAAAAADLLLSGRYAKVDEKFLKALREGPTPDTKCVLCHKKEVDDIPERWRGPGGRSQRGLGDLLLVRAAVNSVAWIHDQCARWSPDVYDPVGDDQLEGLKDAIRRGRMIRCRVCNEKGATLGCMKRTCKHSFHLTCAREFGCLLQVEPYRVACPEHVDQLDKYYEGDAAAAPAPRRSSGSAAAGGGGYGKNAGGGGSFSHHHQPQQPYQRPGPSKSAPPQPPTQYQQAMSHAPTTQRPPPSHVNTKPKPKASRKKTPTPAPPPPPPVPAVLPPPHLSNKNPYPYHQQLQQLQQQHPPPYPFHQQPPPLQPLPPSTQHSSMAHPSAPPSHSLAHASVPGMMPPPPMQQQQQQQPQPPPQQQGYPPHPHPSAPQQQPPRGPTYPSGPVMMMPNGMMVMAPLGWGASNTGPSAGPGGDAVRPGGGGWMGNQLAAMMMNRYNPQHQQQLQGGPPPVPPPSTRQLPPPPPQQQQQQGSGVVPVPPSLAAAAGTAGGGGNAQTDQQQGNDTTTTTNNNQEQAPTVGPDDGVDALPLPKYFKTQQ
jgi:hypothetical protein